MRAFSVLASPLKTDLHATAGHLVSFESKAFVFFLFFFEHYVETVVLIFTAV